MFHDGNILPDFFTVIGVDVIEGDVGVFIKRDEDFSERVRYSWMPPGLINGRVLLVLGAAHADGKALSVQSASSEQELPMEWSSDLVETAGVNEDSGAFLAH